MHASVGYIAVQAARSERHTLRPVAVAQSKSADCAARAVLHSRTVLHEGQLFGRGETPQHSRIRAQAASTIATHDSTGVAVAHASGAASGVETAGAHPTRASAEMKISGAVQFIHRAYRREVSRG